MLGTLGPKENIYQEGITYNWRMKMKFPQYGGNDAFNYLGYSFAHGYFASSRYDTLVGGPRGGNLTGMVRLSINLSAKF